MSDNDHCIDPELEAWMAERARAETIHLASSHVAFLSHPEAVAELIERAAQV